VRTEAGLVSLMPIRPFTAKKASRIWKKNLTETQNILDELASRAILVDFEQNGEAVYALPPPMAGFFRVLAYKTWQCTCRRQAGMP